MPPELKARPGASWTQLGGAGVDARSVAAHTAREEREDASSRSCASDVALLSMAPTGLRLSVEG